MQCKLFIIILPIGLLYKVSIILVSIIKALEYKCSYASKFKIYMLSILLALAIEIGLNKIR